MPKINTITNAKITIPLQRMLWPGVLMMRTPSSGNELDVPGPCESAGSNDRTTAYVMRLSDVSLGEYCKNGTIPALGRCSLEFRTS
jgi:hypothetical protein